MGDLYYVPLPWYMIRVIDYSIRVYLKLSNEGAGWGE